MQQGIDVSKNSTFSMELITSATGISEESWNHMPSTDKEKVYSLYKESLVGELLMNTMGASWDGKANKWQNTDGIKLTITDKAYDGNIMAEVQNGKYLYSTVTATLFRDPDSWNSLTSTDGINWSKNVSNWNKDSILYEKTGINYEYYDRLIVDHYQTVDNYMSQEGTNQPIYDFSSKQWIQGNTVIGNFNMGYYTDGQEISYKYKDAKKEEVVRKYENDSLVINNTYTLNNVVGNHGGIGNSWNDRWLGHDTSNNINGSYVDTIYTLNGKDYITGYSDGCFITTRENQKELMNNLKNKWKFTNGIQIKGSIINYNYNDYITLYPNTKGWK